MVSGSGINPDCVFPPIHEKKRKKRKKDWLKIKQKILKVDEEHWAIDISWFQFDDDSMLTFF